MTETQSITDRLTDLPLSIIHTILSYLPTRTAVRTSILSRQWRYTWTSVHKLEFELSIEKEVKSQELMKDFISHALSIHQGSLNKFKLVANLHESCANMDEWLLRLSTKDVNKFILYILPIGSGSEWAQSVHSNIYLCNKLARLCLVRCDLCPPPSTFKGFLFLRRIVLLGVKISSATFESLVSGSPFLEKMILHQYRGGEKEDIVRIRAPNLKYLYMLGFWTEMYMEAPLLAELYVRLVSPTTQQGGPFYNYCNFLGGCTNLEKLSGHGAFTFVMGIPMESRNPNSLAFHRLRTIKLSLMAFGGERQLRILARLLINSPNLKNLHILIRSLWEDGEAHFSSFGFEPEFRMEKLRAVKMTGVRGLPSEIELIKFLLERSPLLGKLIVLHNAQLDAGEIKDLISKILACTQSSQSADVFISID